MTTSRRLRYVISWRDPDELAGRVSHAVPLVAVTLKLHAIDKFLCSQEDPEVSWLVPVCKPSPYT